MESSSSAAETAFAALILLCAISGVAVNCGCIFLLRRHRSTFHRFLRALAVFDLGVVLCCLWMYSLPALWTRFHQWVFLPTVPYVLPVVQMSLMSSVYSTVIISMERYVRICRVRPLPDKCARNCLLFVVVFPALFYLPKFFEYKYTKIVQTGTLDINCTAWNNDPLLPTGDSITINVDGTAIHLSNETTAVCAEMVDREDAFPTASDTAASNATENFIKSVKATRELYYPRPTWLRENPAYYKVYCVCLNTVFSSLLPLALLLFFNTNTLLSLRRPKPKPSPKEAGRGARAWRSFSSSKNLNNVSPTQDTPPRGHGFEPEFLYLGRHRDSMTSYERLMRKKESRLTRISISIVWLFIFCHVWKLVPTTYELLFSEDGTEMEEWPAWLSFVKHLSHTLIAFNSAVNFLIYAIL